MHKSSSNAIFATVKDALCWAAVAIKIKNDGGNVRSGYARVQREFEPIDVLLPMWRLIKSGELDRRCEHVIMYYGCEGIMPSPHSHDYQFWHKAVTILEPILVKKNIVLREGNNNEEK